MLSNSVAAQLIVFVAMKSVAYIMTSADLCITKWIEGGVRALRSSPQASAANGEVGI
jgi:hypothetical protein